MKTVSTQKKKGFTLIELMIVVSIIGILASIAIPGFKGFVLKAKRAERDQLMSAIVASLKDVYVTNEHFRWDLPGMSYTQGDWHPALVAGIATGVKKNFNNPAPAGDWSSIPFRPDGMVYYHYYAYAWMTPGGGSVYVCGMGDVDADGAPAQQCEDHNYINTMNSFLLTWHCSDDIGTPVWQRCGMPGSW